MALKIQQKFKEEWDNLMDYENIEDAMISIDDFIKHCLDKYEPKNWDFRAYLKERYQLYLSMAKDEIRTQRKTHFDPTSFSEVPNVDVIRYEKHLKDSIATGNSSSTFEQLAHKAYLWSYLNDYGAFLKSRLYQEVKDDAEALSLPLNLNSAGESRFKEHGYGEEFLTFLGDDLSHEMDKLAINRFIAHHGWLEFKFKKQLTQDISNFAKSYDHFVDEEYEPQYWSPAEWKQYEDVFSTFTETLSMINTLKKNDAKVQRNKTHIDLTETFNQFIEEKKLSVKPDTVMQYQISFNFISQILGENFDLSNFDRKKAIEIKQAVINKSANSEKGRDKETLAVKTINRYMLNFSAFLNWCSDNGYKIEKNLFENLKVKETKSSKNNRRPYTSNEIKLMMEYKYMDKREAADFRNDAYWFPKIALYSGMRLNEISGLKTDDFGCEEGIHYMSLYDNDVKTESSQRIIPIHAKLIELGLLEYVEKARQAKSSYVFMEVKKGKSEAGKYGWGEKISKWYNRTLLRNIGIDKDFEKENGKMLDFHGLRTTFISKCKSKGVNEYLTRQIVGHMNDDDITFGVYGSEVATKLDVMKQIIDKITYD
ncbi:site-specific integrase [Shewanella mangrovisoli]|uniref:site-specific integrase n=1 Tax=Shewanella mangrovisoli TaxID=2864211 RepID=UPI00370A316C